MSATNLLLGLEKSWMWLGKSHKAVKDNKLSHSEIDSGDSFKYMNSEGVIL